MVNKIGEEKLIILYESIKKQLSWRGKPQRLIHFDVLSLIKGF